MTNTFTKRNALSLGFYCLFLTFCSNFPFSVQGQVPIYLRFNRLNTETGWHDGLSAYVFKDSRGYVWIGSVEGLGRFDGRQVRIYRQDKTRTGTLSDDNIQSRFFEDPNGNLWFSTFTALHCYNRLRDTFEVFQLKHPDSDQIIRTDYRVVYLQKDGLLWLRAGDDLYLFDTQQKAAKAVLHQFPYVRFYVHTNSQDVVEHIYAANWETGPGITCFSYHNGWLSNQRNIGENTGLKINQIVPEDNELFWLSAGEKGLVLLNIHSGKVELQCLYFENKELTIRDICAYGSRYLLVATYKEGLLLFDKHSKRFVRQWKKSARDASTLPGDNLFALMVDADSILWVSTQNKGVAYVNLSQHKFTPAFGNAYAPERFQGFEVTSLVQGKEEIWIGSLEHGVIALDEKKGIKQWFSASPGNRECLPDSKIENLFYGDGLWAMTRKGVAFLPPGKNRFIPVLGGAGYPRAARLLSGNRYLFAFSQGMFELKRRGKLLQLDAPADISPKIKSRIISLDNAGNLFLGDNNTNIVQYKKSSEIYTYWGQAEIQARLLCHLPLKKENYGYAGTTSGLIGWNSLQGKVFRDSICERIGSQSVYALQEDTQKRLWISASNGLYCWDMQHKHLSVYGMEDGLPALNNPVLEKSNDGRFWVGGPGGLVWFRPEDLRRNSNVPKVQIQNLEVNFKPWTADTFIGEKKHLRFLYSENTLAFYFAALEFSNPQFNRFKYRLNGYQDTWIETEKGMAFYPNLPPGDYVFQVLAANADQAWTAEPRSLYLTVEPPFWKTWYFRLLVALLGSALIALGFWLYMRRKVREKQQEIEKLSLLQQERNRIAAELHDDVGHGLTRIKIISEAAKHWDLKTENRQQLDKLWRSSIHLIEAMGDIIWAIDSENDSLEALVQLLKYYASDTFDQSEIHLTTNFPEAIPQIELSGTKRRNLLLIVKECFHNIVKHSNADQVTFALRIVSAENRLEIDIQDNGIGLSSENLSKPTGGNGFRNIQKKVGGLGGSIARTNLSPGLLVRLTIPIQ